MNRGKLVDIAIKKVAIRFVDITCITAAFWCAYFLRTNLTVIVDSLTLRATEGGLTYQVLNPTNVHLFFGILGTGLIILALTLHHYESSERMRTLGRLDECFVVFKSLSVGFVVVAAVTSFYSQYAFSRSTMILWYALAVAAVSAWRLALKTLLTSIRRAGYNWVKILIVGAGDAGRLLKEQMDSRREFGYRLVGFIDDDRRKLGTVVDGLSVRGDRHAIRRIVASDGVDDVVLALPSAPRETLLELLKICEEARVNVVLVPSLFDLAATRIQLSHFGHVPLMQLSTEGPPRWEELLKRAFDIAISTVGLVLLAPLLTLLCIAIRLESAGPVLFRQVRVGRHGRHFVMYKFRSMVFDAEVRRAALEAKNEVPDGVIFKIRDDPRITRVGRWMRRFSLDELPQLVNVLKGEMSLVGPRPPLVSEVSVYSDWASRRLLTTPGITGLWQVSGRSNTSFHRMVELDLHYIDHWSFWSDLGILVRSIPRVISGRGAS